MRKYSPLFILFEVTVIVVLCLIPVPIYLMLSERRDLVPLVIVLGATFFPLVFVSAGNSILFPLAKRTMDKNLKEKGFERSYTFYNKESYTCGSIFVIDETNKRIAYVSVHNPFAFQTAAASELSDVKSGYAKELFFDSTRYVYFQFRYKNKRTKIPTFTSRRGFMVTSSWVQDGIKKAERMRDSVLRMQAQKVIPAAKKEFSEKAIKELGFEVTNDRQGLLISLENAPSNEQVMSLLNLLSVKEEVTFWNFFHMTSSDPGSYISAHVQDGKAVMMQANHGWSSGYYKISLEDLTELIIRNWDKDWDRIQKYKNAILIAVTYNPDWITFQMEKDLPPFIPDYQTTAW